MFLNNKYTKWYFAIVESAKVNSHSGYIEKHHIIPRCMDGSDDASNIVALSARQHFVCHLLLTKMVDQDHYLSKLKYAAILLYTVHDQKITSKMYETLKSNIKQTPEWINKRTKGLKGRVSPTKGTVAWNKGIPASAESKRKASESLKGKTPWNKGKAHPSEVKKRISETLKTKSFDHMRKKVKCEHCGKESTQSAITRYHNANCKYRQS